MIKRYSIETPPYGKGRMEEDENGKWVRYEDIANPSGVDGGVLPCPFCGGRYKQSTDTIYHRPDCALTGVDADQLNRISKDAWNRRAR